MCARNETHTHTHFSFALQIIIIHRNLQYNIYLVSWTMGMDNVLQVFSFCVCIREWKGVRSYVVFLCCVHFHVYRNLYIAPATVVILCMGNTFTLYCTHDKTSKKKNNTTTTTEYWQPLVLCACYVVWFLCCLSVLLRSRCCFFFVSICLCVLFCRSISCRFHITFHTFNCHVKFMQKMRRSKGERERKRKRNGEIQILEEQTLRIKQNTIQIYCQCNLFLFSPVYISHSSLPFASRRLELFHCTSVTALRCPHCVYVSF